MSERYDIAVIGAGVFGAWTAFSLRATGRSVVLLDAYGTGNSRASSGGESRIIRMAYGEDAVYTQWAMQSLLRWTDLFEEANEPWLFQRTGVLRTAPANDGKLAGTRDTLLRCGAPFEDLAPAALAERFPQFHFPERVAAMLEPLSGVLLARRAVRCVVRQAVANGVDYFREAVRVTPAGDVTMLSGRTLQAGGYVFACGPWLPKLFPNILEGRIVPTRQEVFFFGSQPGDSSFAAPDMPAWIDFSDGRGAYTVPDLENRGLKLAFDRHGPPFDPDSGDRTAQGADEAREFLARRFPALAGAPLLETRVCQYENTSSGDFLLDRHPDYSNMWLAGGGSGHGFKHGPMVGEYVAGLVDGSARVDSRFSLASKTTKRARVVY